MVDLIGALSLTLGLFASLLSLPALIIPRRMGISHRIYALPMMLAPVGLMGIFFAVFPSQLGHDEVAGNQAVSFFLAAVWVVAIGLAVGIVQLSADQASHVGFWRGLHNRWGHSLSYAATRDRQKRAKNVQHAALASEREKQSEADKEREPYANDAQKAREAVEREELEKYRQQVAEAQREAERVRMLNRALEDGRATQKRIGGSAVAPSWANTDDRLNIVFENYRAGLVTLEDYDAAIKSEADAIKERAAELREERKLYGQEYYEVEKEQLDEDRDAVQWRKRWLSDERHRLKNSRPGFAASGKWSRFEYVDADGVITKRHVVNWERRGAYIVGYDKDRREERTFRQDRISDWLAG